MTDNESILSGGEYTFCYSDEEVTGGRSGRFRYLTYLTKYEK